MTWQVSPEEWLLDFTVLPRGRGRSGEGLDAIDDRLRSMLAEPRPAMIMPQLAARTPAPPVPPIKQPEPPAEAVIPVLGARYEPRPPSRSSEAARSISGEIGANPPPPPPRPEPPPPRSISGEIGATSRSEPLRAVSGEIGASRLQEAPRATAGEIGLVMPTLATRPPPPEPPAPEATKPAEPEPRPGLDVQIMLTPSATPSDPASMVIPTLTRGHFEVEVDDDEAEALDRLSPVLGPEIGIPNDDADGDDFMSALASATQVMSTPVPAPETQPEEHLDEVDDLETIDADPEPSGLHSTSALLAAAEARPAAPRPPPADKPIVADKPPVVERGDKPLPPPPPEKAVEKAPPPPPVADKPPPSEKAADKPPPPPPPVERPPPPRPPAAPPAPVKPAPVPAPAPVLVPTPPAASGSQAARKRGWYDEAFAEHFASITPIDSDASAELDVAFIRKTAELGAGQTILDVGCGDGRHCFALANLGLLVTGLECSLPQLVRAAQRNEATDAGITLLQGDMRSLPRDRTYDVVTCLGTTLGYFESEEQNRQCLQEMVEVLRPGGKLVLHMVNRDYLVAVLPCRSWWQGRGCLVLDVADMNYFTNRMRVHRTVVFEDGRQFEHHMYIRAYSLHDLGRMLAGMGMRVLEVSGGRDTRGRFYGATSAEIWLVAQRRDDG